VIGLLYDVFAKSHADGSKAPLDDHDQPIYH
jgi:hypothetical protein